MHILSYVLQNGKLDDTVPSASLTLLKLVHLLWDTLRFPSRSCIGLQIAIIKTLI